MFSFYIEDLIFFLASGQSTGDPFNESRLGFRLCWREGSLFSRERLFSDGCLLVKFLFTIMDMRDKCLRRLWACFRSLSGVKAEKF